jgi:hypothetical protein
MSRRWLHYLRARILHIRPCTLTEENLDPPTHTLYNAQPRTLPDPTSVQDQVRRVTQPPRPRKACMICLEVFWDQDTADRFPHNCSRCASGNFCANCLKDWFLDACRNESKMPPKCCSVIPLSSVSSLLKTAEVSTIYLLSTRASDIPWR